MPLPRIQTLQVLPAVLWIVACPVLLLISLQTDSFKPGLWWELYFAAVSLMSPVAFAAFGWDKWKAKRETSRTPEKTLHFLAILGGWPGAVLGQKWFRHKTVKPVFRAILVSISLLHIITVVVSLWISRKSG